MKGFIFSIIASLFFLASFGQAYPDGASLGNQFIMRLPIGSSSQTPPTPPTTQVLIRLPNEYHNPENANKKYALAWFLHGAGQADRDGKDISRLLSHSLTKLIAQGFSPYGLTPEGDTVWFIVASPQVQESVGGSYSYTQLRYLHPALLKRLRIDQSLVVVLGVSAGGAGAISIIRSDTLFSRKFAGIQIMAGVNTGLGNGTNMTHAIANGVGILHNWGTIDGSAKGVSEGYAEAIEAVPPPPNRYYKYIQLGVQHEPEAWEPPLYRATTWFGGLCAWDRFLTFRRNFHFGYNHSGFNDTIQLPTNSVTLTGEEFPPGGVTVTGRSWTRVVGATSMSITNGTTLTPTFGNLTAGYYRVRMTTTFSNGTTAQDETELLVQAAAPGNQAPTANAGSDITVSLPSTQASLNGSGSFDPDGTITAYSWIKISGPTGSFNNTAISSPIFTATTTGTYVLQLTVTDNSGATDVDQVTVIVNAEPAPTTYPVKEVICSEYKVAFLKSDGTAWAPFWVPGQGTKAVQYNGGHTFADGDGGLYNILLRKENGDVYATSNSTMNLEFLQYDDTGGVFKAIDVECYLRTYIAVRDDGTVWARFYNSYRWFGSDVNLQLSAWTKIPGQPAGVSFTKIRKGGETGSGQLCAITNTGNVWIINDYTTTWYQKTFPVPIHDIHAGNFGYYIAIGTDKQPYGWGMRKYLGVPGTGSISTFEPLRSYWNFASTDSIIDMGSNDNTIHYIKNNNTLWGLGDDAMGLVGRGQELVNRKELYAGPWYVWNWLNATNGNYQNIAFVSTPLHITPGRLYARIFTGNYYTHYKYAQELGTGDLYSWGRNKGSVLMNGKGASNESAIPNSMDVLTPTKVDVFTSVTPLPSAFIPGTINAGANQSIIDTYTTLSGTATAGATGNWSYTLASYAWRQLNGPVCTIASPTTASTVVSGMGNGTYTFEFKVTDNNTATITDTLTVTVSGEGNLIPVVDAGSNITTAATTATLQGVATDADGQINVYSWSQISGPSIAVIADPASDTTLISELVPGVYVFELEVIDDDGAASKDQVTVTVTPPDALPVVNAGNDTTVAVLQVTLNGSASDPDGSIAFVEFTKQSGPAGEVIESPSTLNTRVTFALPGVYVFKLTAFDDDGASSTDTVIITVTTTYKPTLDVKPGRKTVFQ